DRLKPNLSGMFAATVATRVGIVNIPEAITATLSLSRPTPRLYAVDLAEALKNSLSLKDLSPIQIVDGAIIVLDTIESGLKSDLLTKLPLIGGGIDLAGSFVGKLKGLLNDLRTVLPEAGDKLAEFQDQIRQKIFDVLGPGGANILTDGHGNRLTSPDQ